MVDRYSDTLLNPEDTDEYGIFVDRLQAVSPNLRSDPDTASERSDTPIPASDAEVQKGDPGTTVLIENLGPNNPELHYAHRLERPVPEDTSDSDSVMTDQSEVAEPADTPDIQHVKSSGDVKGAFVKPEPNPSPHVINGVVNANSLQEIASASFRESEVASQVQRQADKAALIKRHDSGQEQGLQVPPEKQQPRSGRNSPSLKLQTRVVPKSEDTIATSPTLSKHVITTTEYRPETLPAFQHNSPTREGNAHSPQGEKLPPIHQVVPPQLDPLGELAEAATQRDPRYAHHHSHSFGSTTSQSPMMPYNHYTSNSQASPSSQHHSNRSPNSAFSDPYGSPNQYSHPVAYYAHRRSSATTDQHPPPTPSLPSGSSSGESHGPPSSSADGYSTSHTTPIDLPDGPPRPILPPPPGMAPVVIPAGFKCDYPGCTAPPFQTQYLLRCALPMLLTVNALLIHLQLSQERPQPKSTSLLLGERLPAR